MEKGGQLRMSELGQHKSGNLQTDRLHLFKEALPSLARVAVLIDAVGRRMRERSKSRPRRQHTVPRPKTYSAFSPRGQVSDGLLQRIVRIWAHSVELEGQTRGRFEHGATDAIDSSRMRILEYAVLLFVTRCKLTYKGEGACSPQ